MVRAWRKESPAFSCSWRTTLKQNAFLTERQLFARVFILGTCVYCLLIGSVITSSYPSKQKKKAWGKKHLKYWLLLPFLFQVLTNSVNFAGIQNIFGCLCLSYTGAHNLQ